jgi:hypothetical protein
MSHGMASRGGIDLVEYFIRKSTRDMSTQMKELDLQRLLLVVNVLFDSFILTGILKYESYCKDSKSL